MKKRKHRKPSHSCKAPKLKEALSETGFVACSFKSDGKDRCEQCSKNIGKHRNVYYRRTSYFEDEGQYFCRKCVIEEAGENRKITFVDCESCGNKTEAFVGRKVHKCYDCYAFGGEL